MVLRESTFHEPDPPTTFRWLKDGTLYSVTPEYRGSKQYWYMKKQIAGQRVQVYLGGLGQLEPAILDNAVEHMKAKAQGAIA